MTKRTAQPAPEPDPQQPHPEPQEEAAELSELSGTVARDVEVELVPPVEPDWPFEWMPRFIQALSAIPNYTAAAQVTGITRQWAHMVMARYPEFKVACEEAKERAWELMDRYGWQMGTQGVEQVVTKTRVKTVNGREVERVVETEAGRLVSPQMTQFYLRSRWPERFGREVKVQHTGADGGPIQHEVYRPLDQERALELARITLELEEGDVIEGEADEVEDAEVEPVVEGAITSAGASTSEEESASTPDEPPEPLGPGVVEARR